jgi:hypothetical protein
MPGGARRRRGWIRTHGGAYRERTERDDNIDVAVMLLAGDLAEL